MKTGIICFGLGIGIFGATIADAANWGVDGLHVLGFAVSSLLVYIGGGRVLR